MRILIEEHQYQAELIKDVLHGIDAMQDIEGNVSIHYVGYYYNTQLNDCVFILPKVLLDVLEGSLGVFCGRVGKLLFNLAVEHSITNHLMAEDADLNAESYRKLRGYSVREVTETQGSFSFRDALRLHRQR